MAPVEFNFKTTHATLEAYLQLEMKFQDGDLKEVRVNFNGETITMSDGMFFAVFGGDAHDLYEKAATACQNERLSS